MTVVKPRSRRHLQAVDGGCALRASALPMVQAKLSIPQYGTTTPVYANVASASGPSGPRVSATLCAVARRPANTSRHAPSALWERLTWPPDENGLFRYEIAKPQSFSEVAGQT